MPRNKAIRIELEEGCLRSKRPERVRHLLSSEEWKALRTDLYETFHPALQLRKLMIITLAGIFVVPALAFIILLVLEETDTISIEGDEDFEAAFELLLLIATCGCLGLGVACLLVGSAVRGCCIESSMDVELTKVVEDFDDGREKGAPKTKIDIEMSPTSKMILRRIFLAWSDIDYHLLVSSRELDDETDYTDEDVSDADYRPL